MKCIKTLQDDGNLREEMKRMDRLYTVRISDYTVQKGDDLIYGRLYEPDAESVTPLVLIAHGYNGSWQDWRLWKARPSDPWHRGSDRTDLLF